MRVTIEVIYCLGSRTVAVSVIGGAEINSPVDIRYLAPVRLLPQLLEQAGQILLEHYQ